MAQSLSKIYIHVIFSTKNREPIIEDSWRDELFRVMGGMVNKLQSQSILVGGVSDHIHMLFQLGRTITIADVMRKIKSDSSYWVNDQFKNPKPFHWQNGYAAFSVSQSNVDSVHAYILGQPEHHHTISYQAELRAWLQKYGIKWDERYVWD